MLSRKILVLLGDKRRRLREESSYPGRCEVFQAHRAVQRERSRLGHSAPSMARAEVHWAALRFVCRSTQVSTTLSFVSLSKDCTVFSSCWPTLRAPKWLVSCHRWRERRQQTQAYAFAHSLFVLTKLSLIKLFSSDIGVNEYDLLFC